MKTEYYLVEEDLYQLESQTKPDCTKCEFETRDIFFCKKLQKVCCDKPFGITFAFKKFPGFRKDDKKQALFSLMLQLKQFTRVYTTHKDIEEQMGDPSLLYIQVRNITITEHLLSILEDTLGSDLNKEIPNLYILGYAVLGDELTIKFKMNDTKVTVFETQPEFSKPIGSIGDSQGSMQVMYNGMQPGNISHTMQSFHTVL